MDDLISRLDAITIPVLPKEHRKYQTMNPDDAYESGWFDCQKCIENLPSAQPETCVDAVSRKDAIKDVCDALKVAFAIDEDLEEALDIITTTISTLPSVRPDTKFLDYLWNVINPNEMENYLSMYHSSEEKTDG